MTKVVPIAHARERYLDDALKAEINCHCGWRVNKRLALRLARALLNRYPEPGDLLLAQRLIRTLHHRVEYDISNMRL